MLVLHAESGLRVMRECGQWDGFQAAVGDCSEICCVLNPLGTFLLDTDEGELAYRPEIARNALTKLLMENVPSELVKWNHKITAITLDLGANGTATYDFVVGADDAWSRVRQLLTDVKPFYSGARGLNGSGTLGGGEVVNLALWDSLDLAYALGRMLEAENAAAWQTALEPRMREYEETMLLRAKEKAEETAKNKDMAAAGRCLGGSKGELGVVNQRPDE
ncbi:hypothetical protein V1508DRAFT_435673 [Lipomyces doorenjongii]|uniref:uncharacterized protein n=1 Tax=Lipomyces doorenjongii TaxID=383834 RepID=UPI0034CE7D13